MVNYLFATPEQLEFAELAKQVMEGTLRPRIAEFEHADNDHGIYPMDVHKAMVEAGFYGMAIPEEYGGLGMDRITQAIILEEIAKVDAGFAFNFYNGGNFLPAILETSIPDEEKQAWADKILSGESIGCFGVTESEAGSDASAMQSKAVKDGNEWVITGNKVFITAAPNADFFLTCAWTDKSLGASKGVTAFFVEKERGVKIGKKEYKMGLKLSETAEVIFDEVRVPEDHVIGEVGKGFGKVLGIIAGDGRPMGSVVCLGLAQAALDCAIDYAKTRRQFGKRIIDHEGMAFMIADMKTRTEASRAMVYELLRALDEGVDPVKIKELTHATKTFVADSTMQTCIDAVQVLGGYGYMKEYPVEKYMRDAKIFQIFSGTNQIQKRDLARTIAGRDPLAKPRK